jgi:uncharacterized membrane protein
MDLDDLFDMSGKRSNKHHGYKNDHDIDHHERYTRDNHKDNNHIESRHNSDSHGNASAVIMNMAQMLLKNKLLLIAVVVLVIIVALIALVIAYLVLTTGAQLVPKLTAMVGSLDIKGAIGLVLERILGTGK